MSQQIHRSGGASAKSSAFAPASAPSPVPALAALRAELAQASDLPALERLAARIGNDGRAGARALVQRIEARQAALHREEARLASLLALRDGLAARGVRGIAGVDEVGVGPLAGPVVAAAVVLPEKGLLPALTGLDDSKRVPPARRELLAEAIRGLALGIGIGLVDAQEIDRLGIYHAALEAMRRAVVALADQIPLEHLLVDARKVPGVAMAQTAIIGGDGKDASIAAASIVAKVHRDALMRGFAERHPGYGFERHMGYGTPDHLAALDRAGPCAIHRRSFAPVARAGARP